MNIVELTTSRLILKSITPAFINTQFTSKTAAEIKSFFGFDHAGYEHAKEMHLKGMETHRISLHYFLLIEKEKHTPIGECGFHTWNRTHRRAELFYSMRSDEYKRQGLMKEALKAVLEFGFTGLGLQRIEALVADYNIPSVKLLQRYGFTNEGTMREDYCVDGINEDSDCYSLLKWEWGKQQL